VGEARLRDVVERGEDDADEVVAVGVDAEARADAELRRGSDGRGLGRGAHLGPLGPRGTARPPDAASSDGALLPTPVRTGSGSRVCGLSALSAPSALPGGRARPYAAAAGTVQGVRFAGTLRSPSTPSGTAPSQAAVRCQRTCHLGTERNA